MQSKLPEEAGTGCVHVFCSDIKREGQAESKGEVGCFPQGLWPCRLSLTMGAASGHSDQADEEGASTSSFTELASGYVYKSSNMNYRKITM